MTKQYSPFGRVLAGLMIETGLVRKNSNPDWIRFVAALPTVSYETLRKAVAQERAVTLPLMRCVAHQLAVEPTVFLEYRLITARNSLDPAEVGWKRATEALRSWEACASSAVHEEATVEGKTP
jgi:hypothetical protein